MKSETMAKRSSLGAKLRKRLSDITNSQIHIEEKLPENDSVTDEYVDRLIKENMTLARLLVQRNKIIELSAVEIRNLRVSKHKLQVQNLSLAQSNSLFLKEINIARDKVKALQHEIVCKDALLKAKNSELERKTNEKSQKHELVQRGVESLEGDNGDKHWTKPSNQNRRKVVRSQSMGASATSQKEAKKDKNEKKRHRLRRRSARFRSQEQEPNENLFEIEDINLAISNNNHQDEAQTSSGTENPTAHSHRSSIGRPACRAAEKVRSYKEIPLNVKMRRDE